MKQNRWLLLCAILWITPTHGMGQTISPNPFYGGISRLGVLCRVMDASTTPDGLGKPDQVTAEVIGLAMVAQLSNTLHSSKIVVERLQENSDALADSETLVILLHGRIITMSSLTGPVNIRSPHTVSKNLCGTQGR